MLKTLFITEKVVENNLPYNELLVGIKQALVEYSRKTTNLIQPQRLAIKLPPENVFYAKPASFTTVKALGAKLLTRYPNNETPLPSHQSILSIFNSDNGSLEAVIEGSYLTTLRTAAATAIAMEFLTRKDNEKILTLIGTGDQAVSHLKLLRSVSSFKEIRVCSRSNPENAKRFAKKWNVVAYSSVEEACEDADVLVTLTKSTCEPVLLGKWVKKGAFVSIVGAPLQNQRDVDDDLMKNSYVIADTVAGSYASSGDVIQSKITLDGELGDVIEGKLKVEWDKTRIFKSNGMAVQDIVAGKIVLENIKKQDYNIPLEESPTLILSNIDVEKNLQYNDLMAAIEKGFVEYSKKTDNLIQPQRLVLNITPKNIFFVKPAVFKPINALGAKLLTLYADNESKYQLPSHQSIVIIFNSENGCLEAVMDGIALTDLRTAAATAVAFKYLTKENTEKILTLIGTGHQAVSHLKLLRSVSSFKEIRVCSRSNPENAKQFATKWNVVAYSSVEEACEDADVLVTLTKSTCEPVLLGKWVKKGAFVSIVGAPLQHQRDVDDDLMKNSYVIADTVAGSYASSGDVIQSKITLDGELGDVIEGKLKVEWDKTRIFKSNGMAVQDIVAGKIVINNIKSIGQVK